MMIRICGWERGSLSGVWLCAEWIVAEVGMLVQYVGLVRRG